MTKKQGEARIMARMSDEKYELMQDTKEKKITARSARSTRTHCGKGGKVRFPNDNLSAKELEKMNGECKSYRLNSPMTWNEFKSMPDDLKVMYIKALRKAYNVPDKYIAEMMGVSRPALCKLIVELGIGGGKGSAGAKRTWNEDAWYAWRGGVKPAEKTPEKDCDGRGTAQGTDELIAINENPEIKEYIENDIKIANEMSNIFKKTIAPEDDRLAQMEAADLIKELRGGNYPVMNSCPNTESTIDCTTRAVPTKGEMTFDGNVDDILRTLSTVLGDKKIHLTVKWTVAGTDLPKAAQYAILNAERRKMLNSKG
jgi:hypothetical protein